jgi:hypothetical protein
LKALAIAGRTEDDISPVTAQKGEETAQTGEKGCYQHLSWD